MAYYEKEDIQVRNGAFTELNRRAAYLSEKYEGQEMPAIVREEINALSSLAYDYGRYNGVAHGVQLSSTGVPIDSFRKERVEEKIAALTKIQEQSHVIVPKSESDGFKFPEEKGVAIEQQFSELKVTGTETPEEFMALSNRISRVESGFISAAQRDALDDIYTENSNIFEKQQREEEARRQAEAAEAAERAALQQPEGFFQRVADGVKAVAENIKDGAVSAFEKIKSRLMDKGQEDTAQSGDAQGQTDNLPPEQ